ncbi:Crp/Fnr family transcriptional regulator [Pedobacter endophyticus]|uniref:Crp/Fnr family transcriptional regulator n=1 Tax=Pedobacter endophyticus TaxID=2789740 RepID=A0A7U3SPU9_9SPHI|nr:Crp/Fnr family transcriptional regulator [Pedobacter endophyticus]QPH38903.1 Crp/Fnr family transcriptional regulator [Pedobacter endophyticus]
MIDFINSLNSLSPLRTVAVDDLKSEINNKSYKRGDFILNSGRVCRRLYFLNSGLLKLSSQKYGNEFIMRFFSENSIFTGLDSYITQAKSEYSIITLEPTMVSYISHSKMEFLCQKHHCIETAFRKFMSIASINMLKRISEMLEENATTSYNNFLNTNASILQRISLGDLASYLGITQVSLSRIRSKKSILSFDKK